MSRIARSSAPSLASGWDPESIYGEPTSPNDVHDTSSPQRASSHDEYDPNIPEHLPTASSASDIFTSPSHRNSAVGISRDTRDALEAFYQRIYGPDSKRCLVTGKMESLITAHVVQRASKPEQLTLYEYCLGCNWQTFHVDSRRNLVYLNTDWHTSFDALKWLLLPSFSTLQEVERFVTSVLAARSNKFVPTDFLSRWSMDLKTLYTFMPLPNLAHEPISRRVLNPSETWQHYPHPFNTLPPLECHVSPPLAVINAGPKLIDLDLDQVSLTYHGSEENESQRETKERLALLCRIWDLFTSAKVDAKTWEDDQRGTKRKRDKDDDDVDRLSQRSGRITRSTASSSSQHNSDPTGQVIGSAGSKLKRGPGTRKRNWEIMTASTTTLTGDTLARLGKRQKTRKCVKKWAESTSVTM